MDKKFSGIVAAFLVFAASLTFAVEAAAEPTAAVAGMPGTPARLCLQKIAESEKRRLIPKGLLASIAVVESGRWQAWGETTAPWPWTVTARGVGKFYPSRAAAVAAVRRLKADGVRNIDVGCMQVNLYHHPTAFADLDEALDPARNVAYAAAFLSRLRKTQGSWRKAVGTYHSSTPALHRRYAAKVYRGWGDARRLLATQAAQAAAGVAPTDVARSAAPPAAPLAGSWTTSLAARQARREAKAASLRLRRTRFAAWVAGRLAAGPRGARKPAETPS